MVTKTERIQVSRKRRQFPDNLPPSPGAISLAGNRSDAERLPAPGSPPPDPRPRIPAPGSPPLGFRLNVTFKRSSRMNVTFMRNGAARRAAGLPGGRLTGGRRRTPVMPCANDRIGANDLRGGAHGESDGRRSRLGSRSRACRHLRKTSAAFLMPLVDFVSRSLRLRRCPVYRRQSGPPFFPGHFRMSSHASLGYGVAPVHGRPITVVHLGIGHHGMADDKRGARP